VRYLLWELFVKDEVPKQDLESKPVALAIVQRLCRSKGKDSLVISGENGNGGTYKLNPDYLEDFKNLLSKDLAPEKPKSKPKTKAPKNGVISTRTGVDPALETQTAVKKSTKSKKASGEDGELELPLTEHTDFQFWFEFIRKINARAQTDLTILSNGESAILRIP
jgi:hypothetical protein